MAEEKAAKEAAKATLQALAGIDVKKAAAPVAKAAEPKAESPKVEAAPIVETKDAPKDEAKTEAKAEAKKEADPNKEFVDAIMAEMSLKGGSKKRLVKMLAEKYGFDKQKVLFRLKRALITERYAAGHAEGGGH